MISSVLAVGCNILPLELLDTAVEAALPTAVVDAITPEADCAAATA